MKNLLYYIVWGVFYLLSLLPFWVLYRFSDLLYYPLYHLIGYRKKVVRKNLVTSFPEKSLDEIVRIEKKFYSNLCDYFFETLKMASMSEKQIKRRMRFEGLGQVQADTEQGRSVALYLAHTFNWEWVSSIPLHMSDKSVVFGQIYHALRNKTFDRLFLKLRGRFGTTSISKENTLRRVMEYKSQDRLFVIGFIADQIPKWQSTHHWVDFLHQDTAVFTGTEKIAKKMKCTTYYLTMVQEKRGYYLCKVQSLVENPSAMPDFKLTDLYFERLSETLHQYPSSWLWSHNRWKRTREQVQEMENRIRYKQ
ncbi:MAG: lysophospholipid acyltransferase family protein [Bacteroides sp.]|nr:lysophospholipid acyltransferase family protein [Bacteroides sp.]